MSDKDLENKARYKFQYLPNKETGQKIGNREIVLELDEAIFCDYVIHLLRRNKIDGDWENPRKNGFKEYARRYPNTLVLFFKKHKSEYEITQLLNDSTLMRWDGRSMIKNEWNIMVKDFNSERAVRHSKGITDGS
tara:strand:- start:1412 stop:1816 length:405 start_codon:yes stop_codon:yes gene_type:complete